MHRKAWNNITGHKESPAHISSTFVQIHMKNWDKKLYFSCILGANNEFFVWLLIFNLLDSCLLNLEGYYKAYFVFSDVPPLYQGWNTGWDLYPKWLNQDRSTKTLKLVFGIILANVVIRPYMLRRMTLNNSSKQN